MECLDLCEFGPSNGWIKAITFDLTAIVTEGTIYLPISGGTGMPVG